MKSGKHPIFIICLAVLVFIVGCNSGDGEDDITIDQSILVGYTKIFTWPKGELKGRLNLSGLDLPIDKIAYDVTIYDVEYQTPYKGQMITASGRVMVPETKDQLSTTCFSHGTIGSDEEAFTSLAAGNNTIILLSGLASMGMVTVAPDLIGFGASSEYYHPYYIHEPTATATINNILASRLLAQELNLKVDNELYLAGYSQGGYSTMSTHKYIEQNGIEYFELKASFPSSGGYNIEGMQDYFFEQETYHQPFYLAYVAQAYFDYYDWEGTHSLTEFFKEPYASKIPDLVDGTYSGGEINEMLTTTVADLINESYLNDPKSAAYTYLIDAYNENSPTGWTPTIPMHMYHGDADITVPYQNSVGVYNAYITGGASESVVSFTTLPGGTHATGVGPYLEGFLNVLIDLEND